jgi:hypothetical protein
MGKRAADAIAVDHGDSRLVVHPELVTAPLAVGAGLGLDFGLTVGLAEIFLEVLPGTVGRPFAGQNDQFGVGIGLQLFHDFHHFRMECGAHGVAFFGTVEDHPGDPVLLLVNFHACVLLRQH